MMTMNGNGWHKPNNGERNAVVRMKGKVRKSFFKER